MAEEVSDRAKAIITILVLLMALFLWRCTPIFTGRSGDPAVYDEIESLTDCHELSVANSLYVQYYGETGEEKFSDYSDAAEDRMKELGC
jgi:hypothetical protein